MGLPDDDELATAGRRLRPDGLARRPRGVHARARRVRAVDVRQGSQPDTDEGRGTGRHQPVLADEHPTSAARLYWENRNENLISAAARRPTRSRSRWPSRRFRTTICTDLRRRGPDAFPNLIYFNEAEAGGHFRPGRCPTSSRRRSEPRSGRFASRPCFVKGDPRELIHHREFGTLWERLWRSSGIIFVVFFVIAYVMYGLQPKVGGRLRRSSRFTTASTRILMATLMFGSAVLFLLWFAAAIRSTLHDTGQGGWGAAATASSAALGDALALVAVGAALAYSIAGSGNDTLTSGLNDLVWVCIVVSSFPRAMLIMAGTFGLWRAKMISNTLFWAGVAAVVLVLVGGMTWASNGSGHRTVPIRSCLAPHRHCVDPGLQPGPLDPKKSLHHPLAPEPPAAAAP